MSMTIGEGDLRSDRITVVVEEDLRELIPGYLENRRKDITTIREALAGSDYETIRSLGHKMKGSGGGYGFDAITELGHDLEAAAKSEHAEEISRLNDALASYLERLEVVYQA